MPYVLPVSKKPLIWEFVDEPSMKMPAPSSPKPVISPPFERSTSLTPSPIVKPSVKELTDVPLRYVLPVTVADFAELITTPSNASSSPVPPMSPANVITPVPAASVSVPLSSPPRMSSRKLMSPPPVLMSTSVPPITDMPVPPVLPRPMFVLLVERKSGSPRLASSNSIVGELIAIPKPPKVEAEVTVTSSVILVVSTSCVTLRLAAIAPPSRISKVWPVAVPFESATDIELTFDAKT